MCSHESSYKERKVIGSNVTKLKNKKFDIGNAQITCNKFNVIGQDALKKREKKGIKFNPSLISEYLVLKIVRLYSKNASQIEFLRSVEINVMQEGINN